MPKRKREIRERYFGEISTVGIHINVLFGISFTLKPNKKLTTRIDCFNL
jgi:hypothetical protein